VGEAVGGAVAAQLSRRPAGVHYVLSPRAHSRVNGNPDFRSQRMDIGRVILRGTVGPLFVGHGTQKLFGWFGGYGLDGTGGFFEQIGMRPGKRHAAAAGAAETLGGVLITLGFLTPAAAAMLTGVMVTAIRKVHIKKGVWITDGGFEYNAVLIGAVAALVDIGPGRPSVDAKLMPRLHGPALALLSVGAGAAGALLNEQLFNEPAPPETAEPATVDAEEEAPEPAPSTS
jgi:putative oxidoreductase